MTIAKQVYFPEIAHQTRKSIIETVAANNGITNEIGDTKKRLKTLTIYKM